MGGDVQARAQAQDRRGQSGERLLDLPRIRDRDLRRLQVRALGQPDRHARSGDAEHVGGRAVQRGLQAHADVVVAGAELLEDGDGALGVLRGLHVDHHQRPVRRPQDPLAVRHAEVLGDVQAELGELDRDVRVVQAGGLDPAERRGVAGRSPLGLLLVGHVLAQEVEHGPQPAIVEVACSLDRLVEGVAGHEPPGDATAHGRVGDQPADEAQRREPDHQGPQRPGHRRYSPSTVAPRIPFMWANAHRLTSSWSCPGASNV